MEDQSNTNVTNVNGTNGNGAQPAKEMNPDHDLVYRIKHAIDSRGRYSFRLQDMTAGFASGQGISNSAARQEIEDRFTAHVGLSPKDYLDKHYEERRKKTKEIEQTRLRNRESERDQQRSY